MTTTSDPTAVGDPSGPTEGRDGSPAHAATVPARRFGRRRRSAPPLARVARVLVGGAVTVLCAVLLWWWAVGGTWLTVSTPSMGRDAPVGTLLWVKHTDVGDIRVGDVVTFRTPDGQIEDAGPTKTYTHRVVARNPDGTLTTKGDLNGAVDAWRVDQDDLVGRVAARWWGVGWLVKALPLLVLGGIAWWVLTAVLATKGSRAPLRLMGVAVLASAAIYMHNPLFGATQLSFVPLGPPGARATYVGTGLLPVRLEADDASPVLVHAGEKRSILTTQQTGDGRYEVDLEPTIPWQTWVVVVVACLAPAVWSVIVGVDASPSHGRRRRSRRSSGAG